MNTLTPAQKAQRQVLVDQGRLLRDVILNSPAGVDNNINLMVNQLINSIQQTLKNEKS